MIEAPADRALDALLRVAYLALVLFMLWMYLPAGAKEAIRKTIATQLWVYRAGLALNRPPTPAWKREAWEVRHRPAPAEPAEGAA